MLRHRVVPVLLAKDGGLVKTRRFRKPVYVGDPSNAMRIFNEKEVDELALLDIRASRRGTPDFDLVERVASECFMPLAYGGGVRDAMDARRLFASGVEKVVVRTAAARDVQTISRIAEINGSQSVAVAIDVVRDRSGACRLHAPGTSLHRSRDWRGFMREAIGAGAGEVVLTAVARDGEMNGLDLELVGQAAEGTPVPLMAVGGVGSLSDIGEGIRAGADAVGAGAYFVLHGPLRAVLITYPSQDELASVQLLVEGD